MFLVSSQFFPLSLCCVCFCVRLCQDSVKLRNMKKSLKKSIKDASLTYNDLETCVQLSTAAAAAAAASQSNNKNIALQSSQQQQQSQLPPNELYERQCFAKACQDRLNQAREQVHLATTTTTTSSSTSSITTLSQQQPMITPNGNGSSALHSFDRRKNGVDSLNKNHYNNNHNNSHHTHSTSTTSGNHNNTTTSTNKSNNNGQRESLLLHQHQQHQEETLDHLTMAVTRVGTMADMIHEEIDQQGKMLDDMESDLIQTEEQLGIVMEKLSIFLGTKNRFQLCTIVILSITVIILLFLIIYIP